MKIQRHYSALVVCLLLIATTSAVYWQVEGHEFVSLDDTLYITENPHVQAGLTRDSVTWAFTSAHASNWHPLTWLSHMLDYELYGLDARGHLVTNVLFHILNSVLLFLLLRRMTGALWRSAFVAAIFALHPLHVESVAWASERKDVLSTLFWMLTMWTYVRYVERPAIKRYLLVLVSFALGLMAKPTLVTLPFVLLLLDYWPLCRFDLGQLGAAPEAPSQASADARQSGPLVLSLIWEKAPLFALAAISSVITLLAQEGGGALRSWDNLPLSIRLANGLVSYVKYMLKAIWPTDLAVFYPHPGTNLPTWQFVGAGVLLVCITIWVTRAARHRRHLIVGWLWYVGTLIPVIGLIQVGGQAMADRYASIPLVGLSLMIAWTIPESIREWHHRRMMLAISSAMVIMALAIGTWLQVRHWRNSRTLFERTVNVTVNNYVAHSNLGAALGRQGRHREATLHLLEALRIRPDYAEAHNNLGLTLARQGRLDVAIVRYKLALQIDPDYAEAHNNLGVSLERQERSEEAVLHFVAALQAKTDYAEAHNNLGLDLAQHGRLEDAIFHFSEALRINPSVAGTHNNLGFAKAQQGRLEEAGFHFREALRLDPDDVQARNNLGIVLEKSRRISETPESIATPADSGSGQGY